RFWPDKIVTGSPFTGAPMRETRSPLGSSVPWFVTPTMVQCSYKNSVGERGAGDYARQRRGPSRFDERLALRHRRAIDHELRGFVGIGRRAGRAGVGDAAGAELGIVHVAGQARSLRRGGEQFLRRLLRHAGGEGGFLRQRFATLGFGQGEDGLGARESGLGVRLFLFAFGLNVLVFAFGRGLFLFAFSGGFVFSRLFLAAFGGLFIQDALDRV